MQEGVQEEELSQKLPLELVIQKANQLRACYQQFLLIKSPYSTGLYVVYKWGFELVKQANRAGHIFFKVQLINLSNSDTAYRIWEAKDNHLLNDGKLSSVSPFGKFGYMYADWWQELSHKGMSTHENKSLDLAIQAALVKVDKKTHHITITDAAIRVRFESTVKIEYKFWIESTDDENKVYSIRAHVSFSKEFRDVEVLDVGLENVNNPKGQVLSLKDQEDALLVARNDLITKGKSIVFEGDSVIDYYYLRSAELIDKDLIKATFDLLVVCQDARIILVSMHLLMNSQRRTIEIQKAKQLIYNHKTITYIMRKGNRLSSWQKFSLQETNLENPTINNIVNAWMIKNRNTKYVVREILKAETRLRRDPLTHSAQGFEYIIVVKIGYPMGTNSTQEWKVFATMEEEPSYEITSTKDIEFVDRARRTSEFTSFARSRVPRASDILNSSLVIIKERESARKQESGNTLAHSINFSPKPSEDFLGPKKLLNSSELFTGPKEDSPKKKSNRYIDNSFDSKLLKKPSETHNGNLLPIIEQQPMNTSSTTNNNIKVMDSCSIELESNHHKEVNDIDMITQSLINPPLSNLMNKRPTSEHYTLRNVRKGEIRPFTSSSPKNTVQVFSTLITSQNLKKKKKSTSRSPEGNIIFPTFQGPTVRKRPKNRSSLEKKKTMLCEILEKQLQEHKKNNPKFQSYSLENSFS